MNAYQQFIAKSRYARFLDNKGRREDWHETVGRFIGFMQKQVAEKHNFPTKDPIWAELQTAITNLEVLPSMRAIMTAGEALERQNVAAYNCSYLPVDHPRAFDEAMYILLCGTGVGFSAERRYTDNLPGVPGDFRPGKCIVVEDSKEGWASALRGCIEELYSGHTPTWDLSLVRPAGARLKTFGGRASGPGPLNSLLTYTVEKFQGAAGRQLSTIEVHDLMCKIGEVVVVGGVRRSAMISLGDLTDKEHAEAKAGAWWEKTPERALSNNSAVYSERPSVGEFMKEWSSIYESKSGERGIFNREASQKQAAKFGRREENVDYGTNPCSEIILRPYQFCNLSTVAVRPTDTIEDLSRKIRLASILGTLQSTLTHFPYLRPIWTKNTEEERLLGVSLTGIYGNAILNGSQENTAYILRMMRDQAVYTNQVWASRLAVPASASVTCVKPEGTVSQLTLTASGLHPAYSPYYIRTVRQDNKDPLTSFLISAGVPHEPCVMKPNDTTVFSFPMEAGPGAITQDDISALSHLDLWLTYQRNWCEHKPSVTISVAEHEWPEVGAWVWKNFDECTGVSFLPHAGNHTYRQAPYQAITEEEYKKLKAEMPIIDWSQFVEHDDNVEGVQTLACVAGVCSI